MGFTVEFCHIHLRFKSYVGQFNGECIVYQSYTQANILNEM